jgi:hypothetical protein
MCPGLFDHFDVPSETVAKDEIQLAFYSLGQLSLRVVLIKNCCRCSMRVIIWKAVDSLSTTAQLYYDWMT